MKGFSVKRSDEKTRVISVNIGKPRSVLFENMTVATAIFKEPVTGKIPLPVTFSSAGSTDGDAVRQGFYKIASYDGLIKRFSKPFSPANHDAVNENDYVWTQFIDNQILPVGMKK